MNASVYYQQLLHNLQDHYGIQITKMNAQQLEGMISNNKSMAFLVHFTFVHYCIWYNV